MPRDPQPWASGPGEILRHGLELLDRDTDPSRRLALILIDNAVELTIKTYLGLPKRITGLTIPRKRLQEIADSFPSLLDGLDEFASDKIEGVDLGAVEWYHRLRNELYHQGNGLTVERDKIEIYAELANTLFESLFGIEMVAEPLSRSGRLGEFLEMWNRLETAITEYAARESPTGARPRSLMEAATFLEATNYIGDVDVRDLTDIQQVRNKVVHGLVDYREAITAEMLDKIRRWIRVFSKT